MKNYKMKPLATLLSLVVSGSAFADLIALDDDALSKESGAGLGMVLEDFVLQVDEDATASLTGINSSDNSQTLEIDWSELYIMGEGSNNGTEVTPGQIGSLMHPWVLRSVRGSGGLDVSDANYNERYSAIGSDIALLEFATDVYESPVQNSASFGLFSLYQGCIWGDPGCNNSSIAVNGISERIDTLSAEKSDITIKYSSLSTSWNMTQLENSIEYNLSNQIANQEAVIASREAALTTPYNNMASAWSSIPEDAQRVTPVGAFPPCEESAYDLDVCNAAERTYVDRVKTYNTAYASYSDARRDLAAMYQDPDIAGGNGVSLNDRMRDLDRFKTLCGSDVSDADCSNGLIAVRQDQKGTIQDIAFAFGQGVSRRKGLDIGSKFEFVFKDAATGAVERTDTLNIDMKGVYLDGSYFRLWSRNDELNGEIAFNLFAKQINIETCGSACEGDVVAQQESTLYLNNFLMSLNLGYGDVQPMLLSATSDGNFEFTLVAPRYTVNADGTSNAQEVYADFYENAPKSYLYVGDVQLGTSAQGNLGSIVVDGLRATYLKVTSHDL